MVILAILVLVVATILVIAVPGSSPSGPNCGNENPPSSDGKAWVCTFDDEFSAATGDAHSLDPAKWTQQVTSTSGYITGLGAGAACYEASNANVSVSDGYLDLTARKEAAPFTCTDPAGNFTTQYTSGQVTSISRFSQTYGRFEARAKLPTTAAKGLQETLWLYPVDPHAYGPSPASGEIDYSEFYSEFPTLDIPYLHYNVAANATPANVVTATTCHINEGQFNTYVAIWQPGTISISVNGVPCLTDRYSAAGLTSPAPFDRPFFLALTQALGVGTNAFDPATTPLPATTQIDYVRVWK